jgi:hypothetical protein
MGTRSCQRVHLVPAFSLSDGMDMTAPATNGLKRCSKCHTEKPIDEFARKRTSRASRCKECHNHYGREHYARTRAARTSEIHEYNKSVTADRQVLVRALTASLHCPLCGKNVWLTELSTASRNQVSKLRFKRAAERITWACRSRDGSHTGTLTATVTDWLAAMITGLAPTEEVFADLCAAIDVQPEELAVALDALVAAKRVFSPIEGWVQPCTSVHDR